jgi:hypothetical protein
MSTTTNTPMATGPVVAGSEDTGVSMRRYTAADLLAVVRVVAGAAGRRLVWLAGWMARHYHWTVAWMVVAAVLWSAGVSALVPVLAGVGPGVVCAVWAGLTPSGYERWCAGPARRLGWRIRSRRSWAHVARTCGLSARQVVARKRDKATGKTGRSSW